MFGLSCHSLILKKLQHDVQDMVLVMSIYPWPSSSCLCCHLCSWNPSGVGPVPSSNCPYSAGPVKKERTATEGGDEKEKRMEWQIVHKSNLLGIFPLLPLSGCSLAFFWQEQMLCQEHFLTLCFTHPWWDELLYLARSTIRRDMIKLWCWILHRWLRDTAMARERILTQEEER